MLYIYCANRYIAFCNSFYKQCAQSGVHNIKTTMKQIIFTLAFILTTFLCFGQNNITHLEPARDFSKYTGNLKEYYDGIFPLLYKGFLKNQLQDTLQCRHFSVNIHFP